ncbi:MAG: repressor LexA [Lentisphaerae bacterium]|nr:repressor LexA [Lentisphaerota bacterium]
MPRKTDIQAKLQKLRRFFRENRRMPGYNEMLELFDYRSKNAVFQLLRKFEALGYVRRNRGRVALTATSGGGVRLLGAIQAGFPSPAEEELAGAMSLDEFLIQKPQSTFMLTVSGDSMIEAGIHPGDLVLVEKGGVPRNHDIVIAQVDDEWTLKYFIRDDSGVRLVPANRNYQPIVPQRSLLIGGVVKAVIRKYR